MFNLEKKLFNLICTVKFWGFEICELGHALVQEGFADFFPMRIGLTYSIHESNLTPRFS